MLAYNSCVNFRCNQLTPSPQIFLTGFSEEELMVVYKIVNLGGGVRLDRLSEEISHVVMGDREQSVVTTIQHLNSRFAWTH